jgi:hypothetical protein
MMMACKVSAAMTGVMVSLDREERAVKTSSEASEFSAAAGIQRAWDLAPFSPASSRIAVSAARWYRSTSYSVTNYAREHPEVVVVVVQSAASDWVASHLAGAIERCEQFYTDTDARSAQTYSYGALPVISPRPKRARAP